MGTEREGREKRWSISSAGGEKNSSSVSRGVSGREMERGKKREIGMRWGFGARRNGGSQRWQKGMDRHTVAAQSR
ncbi:hypothetical protein PAMP_007856 [Pampus punctatissimus]